jgi:hypothetical protein
MLDDDIFMDKLCDKERELSVGEDEHVLVQMVKKGYL